MQNRKSELCISCGLCCKLLVIATTHDLSKPRNREFCEARGFKCIKGKSNGQMAWLLFTDKFPCPNLTDFGCKIYPTRPEICREFDGQYNPFLGGKCKWGELEG